MMRTVTGIFTTSADAKRAVERLRTLGIPQDNINYLAPGSSAEELITVQTVDAERRGVGTVLGGVAGGAAGASGGLLGAAVLSAVVPGIGPVAAIGLAAAAFLGAGGAVAGSAAGSAMESALSDGLPKDELFVYADALRQGRTVLIVLAEEGEQRDRVQAVLVDAGAESLDAAREHWWLGLRDAEGETYAADGGDFSQDEILYRRGFESALHGEICGKTYEEAQDFLRAHYGEVYAAEAFRRGYVRGRAYYQDACERYGQPSSGPGSS